MSGTAQKTRDPLLVVTAPWLFNALDIMNETATLRNGVQVTKAQVRKAAEILRDGPQPIANGIQDDMPGFIDRNVQSGKSLVLQVGILPKRTYRIDKLGRARVKA